MDTEMLAPPADATEVEPRLTPKDAQVLADYSRAHYLVQLVGIVAFFVLVGLLIWQMARAYSHPVQLLPVVSALFAGYLVADLVSGLVHWGFDTWGSIHLPVLGNAFIRPFREHHFDELAITRHGFVQTNGNNSLAALPVLVGTLFVSGPAGATWPVVLDAFMISLVLSVFATNQFHAWAHAESVPRFIALLQRWHLILPPAHHAVHHVRPHDTHYCITTGWLNGPLRAIGFFRGLEKIIVAVTGLRPREDDLG